MSECDKDEIYLTLPDNLNFIEPDSSTNSNSILDNVYTNHISNYSEFVKFASLKNENKKKFTNLTKIELQRMVDYNRRMQTDFKYSDLEINIGSAKIILFEQKKIKYIMININKIEKKLLELIRWSSMSFPTDFQIDLIIYK